MTNKICEVLGKTGGFSDVVVDGFVSDNIINKLYLFIKIFFKVVYFIRSHNQLKEINWSFLTVFPKIMLLDLSHNNFSTLENLTLPLMAHLHNL